MTDAGDSRWLDVHRPQSDGSRARDEAESEDSASTEETDRPAPTDSTADPWDGVEATRRPSRTNADRPGTDRSPDD